MDFHKIWYLSILQKSVEKIQVSLEFIKIWQETGTLHEDIYDIMLSSM